MKSARTILAVMAAAICGTAAVLMNDPTPRLLWNASPSVPIGLYWVDVGTMPRNGDLAAIMPPPTVAGFLAERGYLPLGLPLIKEIAAVAGQVVCRFGHTITVDGVTAATARSYDRSGRPLPSWQGCRTLGDDEFFILNAARQDSLDGRYFGPFPADSIVGVATPFTFRSGREREAT
jgi:conjugative transfer signal peptidase TraF